MFQTVVEPIMDILQKDVSLAHRLVYSNQWYRLSHGLLMASRISRSAHTNICTRWMLNSAVCCDTWLGHPVELIGKLMVQNFKIME